MKKNLIVCIGMLLSVTAWNQSAVQWSELTKANGRITNVLPVGGADFYTTRWSGGVMLGSLQMSKHSNFTVSAQEKISNRLEEGTGDIEAIKTVGKTVIVFLSDKKDKVNKLYMQKYDAQCTPEGNPIQIAEYDIPKGWKKSGYFNVIQSQNQQFFCVEYSIPETKSDNERFGYKILDAKFKTVAKGEYESPYEAKISSVTHHYISNTGDYFLAVKVYNTNERGKVRDYTNLKKISLMQITADGVEEMDLDLPEGKRISDLTFSSDNNRLLTFTGLYGTTASHTAGVFYFQLDFKKKDIIHEGYNKFEKDFVTEGWSERSKQKADKREAKGKGTPALFNYDIRENVTLADGSVIGLLEQFYIREVTTTDSKGNTRTTYYYYYNDVIAYHVSVDGEFDWVKKIQKRQVSTNDGGYLSSFSSYVSGDKLTLIFNDNLKNYSESGKYLDPKGIPLPASYRKKSNCVAKVDVDLKKGEVTRKTYFGREEAEAVAVPKLFNVDYNNDELLMVLRMRKKEKFGLVKF